MICSRNTCLLRIILSIMIVLEIGSVLILSGTPPVSKDALVHHLAVPKLYLTHGGMYEIPCMPFSYYPMNLDLLYLIPLWLGNDIAAKWIHMSFALLTALLIFSYLRSRLNSSYALLGAFFFLSLPVIVRLSITVYVDLGLIFFSSASLIFVLRWAEKSFRLRYLVLSALFCGLAMGTKYNGLIIFFLLTLSVPAIYSRGCRGEDGAAGRALLFGMLFAVISIALFSPWMIRNIVWTGNPFFPLFNHFFDQGDNSVTEPGIFVYRALAYGEDWPQLALLPVRIFYEGMDNNPQLFDGRLNPFLLVFALAAFLIPRSNAPALERNLLGAFAVLYFAFVLLSVDLRMRYIAPILPPLIILSIFGFESIVNAFTRQTSYIVRRLGKTIAWILFGFALYLNGTYLLDRFEEVRPFDFLSGKVTRDEYVERYRPEHAAMRFINKELPTDSRLLLIHMGKRGYYCHREYLLDMNRGRSSIESIIRKADSPAAINLGLRRLGIDHLLINVPIFQKWLREGFTVEEIERTVRFFNEHSKLLFFKNAYGVYGLSQENL